MKLLDVIFNFIFHISKMKDKANQIKETKEKRENSIYFGILSIVYSISSLVLCMLGAWLFSSFMDTGLILFTIIIGIGLMLGGVVLFIWSLVSWILQFSINKKWIGWLALLIFIVGVVVSIVFVLIKLTM